MRNPTQRASIKPRPIQSDPRAVIAFIALAVGAGLAVQDRSARASVTLLVMWVVVGGAASTFGVLGDVTEQLTETRLVVSSSDRQHEWDAALGQFLERPVTGQGPSRVEFTWQASDGRWLFAEYAHNEYLEVLATHGFTGFVALGLGCLVVLLGIRHRTRSPCDGMRSDGYRIGALGALAVFAAHSAFDFLWHIPVLPLVAALLAGFLLTAEHTNVSETGRPDPSAQSRGTLPISAPQPYEHSDREYSRGTTNR